MKSRNYFIILTLVLIFLQVFLFNQVDLMISAEYAPYLIVYPLIYMAIPPITNRYVVMTIAFFLGLFIDIFFDSPGVHAGASVAGAYFRRYVLDFLQIQGGLDSLEVIGLRKYNIYWLAQYNGVVLLIHCLFLFSLEIFTFYFLDSILIKAILTTLFSLLMIIVIQLLYRM